MRLLALLLLATALTGCTNSDPPYQPVGDDPTGTPGDPGTDTGTTSPGTTATTGTTTGPTTGTTTSGNPTGAPGSFAPQEHHVRVTDPAVPGLVLEGDLFPCDAGHCIDVHADNEGNQTYFVQVLCQGPWKESMSFDDAEVAFREPRAHCAAFSLEPMTPQESRPYATEWNGTLWSEDGGYTPAPQGSYVWHITFEVWESEEGEGRHELVADFPVVAGPS